MSRFMFFWILNIQILLWPFVMLNRVSPCLYFFALKSFPRSLKFLTLSLVLGDYNDASYGELARGRD
jgi:hypothetical protein